MKAQDARVLLTGASGGLGQAMAEALVDAGASVMLVGRDDAKLGTQLQALVRHHAGAAQRLAWQQADVCRGEDLERLAEAASAWGCNTVVHGAGLPAFGRLQSIEPGAMAQVIETNLLAPMRLTQALLPHLLTVSRSQVICVGSALGRIGLPGFSVYSASKFGLRGFCEALRRELAGSGVLVQYLGPRSTRTAFNTTAVEAYNHATGTAMDDPAKVGGALLDLLRSERPERFIGFPESLAVRLNGLMAGWLDGAFSKHRSSLPSLTPPSLKETP
jgi:short-subunit dehydrogenase